MKATKRKNRRSRQREEQPTVEYVKPSIHFRRVKCCPKCGADKQSFEFIIMDEQPGERTATPDELMQHGFHVPPASVDLVASLIAQQFAKWHGVTRFIPGLDLADHTPPAEEESEPEPETVETIRDRLINSESFKAFGARAERAMGHAAKFHHSLFSSPHARSFAELSGGLGLSSALVAALSRLKPNELSRTAAAIGSSRAKGALKVAGVGKISRTRKS